MDHNSIGEREFWEAMNNNPLKTHEMIISSGGFTNLCEFVREMAIKHKITLEVKPSGQLMTQRWKDVARCMLADILPENPTFDVSDPQVILNPGIMRSHVRRAYFRRLNSGKKVVIEACIINPFKLDKDTRSAMLKLLGHYNASVVKQARDKGVLVESIHNLIVI
jgi:hypothetical protein